MRFHAKGTLTVAVLLLIAGCGGEEGDTEAATAEEAIEAAAETQESEQQETGQDESEEVQAFLTEYETFIDQYCELADRLANASMTEMVQLTQNMATQAQQLSELATRGVALETAFSESAQEKLEELEARADECTERMGG